MKQISLIFLAGILLCPNLNAQNKLFIPFGKSTEEVKKFLETRDYVHGVVERPVMATLIATVDEGKVVEYAFDTEDKHYATTVSRTYATTKESSKFRESCLEYMKLISKNQIERNNYGRIVCHTAIGKDAILKFFVISHGDTQTLQLTSISRLVGPSLEKDLTHYEEKILNKGFATH